MQLSSYSKLELYLFSSELWYSMYPTKFPESSFVHSLMPQSSCEGFSRSGNITTQQNASTTEVAYNLLDPWKAWIVLQPFPSFAKHGLHTYNLPGSRRLPKNRKQTHWMAKEASKAVYGYPMSGKWYIVHLLSDLSTVIWHTSLVTRSQII